jgi:hypothetical protein
MSDWGDFERAYADDWPGFDPDYLEPIEPDREYTWEDLPLIDRALLRLGRRLDPALEDELARFLDEPTIQFGLERLSCEDDRGLEDYLIRAAVLFLRRWLLDKRAAPWPGRAAAALLLARLLACQAARATARVTAPYCPATALVPGAGDTYARILLIAPGAPPAPVIASAGATG